MRCCPFVSCWQRIGLSRDLSSSQSCAERQRTITRAQVPVASLSSDATKSKLNIPLFPALRLFLLFPFHRLLQHALLICHFAARSPFFRFGPSFPLFRFLPPVLGHSLELAFVPLEVGQGMRGIGDHFEVVLVVCGGWEFDIGE